MVKDCTLKNSFFFQDENFPELVFGVKKLHMYDFMSPWKDLGPFEMTVYFNPGETENATDVICIDIGDVLKLKKKLHPDSADTVLVQIDSIFFKNKGRSATLSVSHI